MKNETEAKTKDNWDMDDILDAIERRRSMATDEVALEAAASKGPHQFGDHEDYYAQSSNLPACYEAEFYPNRRR